MLLRFYIINIYNTYGNIHDLVRIRTSSLWRNVLGIPTTLPTEPDDNFKHKDLDTVTIFKRFLLNLVRLFLRII